MVYGLEKNLHWKCFKCFSNKSAIMENLAVGRESVYLEEAHSCVRSCCISSVSIAILINGGS